MNPPAVSSPLRPVVKGPGLDVQYVTIPSGEAGTLATLKVMAELARAQIRDPATAAEFGHWARAIVRDVPSKDYEGEAAAIFGFVREHVRYRLDPRGLERVQWPYWTLLVDGAGDCDDMATLIAALSLATGHGAMLRAVKVDASRPDAYSHVYALIGIDEPGRGPRWLAADATQRQAFLGWEPPTSRQYGPPLDVVVAPPA